MAKTTKPDPQFEIEFYEAILRRNRDYTEVVGILGALYTKVGRIADGLKMDRKLVRLEPDNATAHYNLALIHEQLGDSKLAAEHRALHERYRVDDNARDRAVTVARRADPAADHAAQAIVIYSLQRAGAPGLADTKPTGNAGVTRAAAK